MKRPALKLVVVPAKFCAGCGSWFRSPIAEHEYCDRCKRKHWLTILKQTRGEWPDPEKLAG